MRNVTLTMLALLFLACGGDGDDDDDVDDAAVRVPDAAPDDEADSAPSTCGLDGLDCCAGNYCHAPAMCVTACGVCWDPGQSGTPGCVADAAPAPDAPSEACGHLAEPCCTAQPQGVPWCSQGICEAGVCVGQVTPDGGP
jgi:hypothetical protein